MNKICVFFFNDTATTEIYTLSLHDALPDLQSRCARASAVVAAARVAIRATASADTTVPAWCLADAIAAFHPVADRKSTRLNSSHANISYAVFCLKKKKILYYYSHSSNIPSL